MKALGLGSFHKEPPFNVATVPFSDNRIDNWILAKGATSTVSPIPLT